MESAEFNKLVSQLENTRIETLKAKNAKYGATNDPLHNFSRGAAFMRCTRAQCAWNYAVKHIVALQDKVMSNNFSDMNDLLEKIQDIQNYLTFIWVIANAESAKNIMDIKKEDCSGCDFRDDSPFSSPCAECPANGYSVTNDLQREES